MSNTILIGFPCTGKTVIGKQLARLLNCNFIDIDLLIEIQQNQKIPDIFKNHGENFFRKLEQKTIQSLSDIKNSVIACGGGLTTNQSIIPKLKNLGTIIELICPQELILKRLKQDKTRPLLKNKTDRQLLDLYKIRKTCYACADFHITVTNLTPEQAAKKIIRKLKLKNKTYTFG